MFWSCSACLASCDRYVGFSWVCVGTVTLAMFLWGCGDTVTSRRVLIQRGGGVTALPCIRVQGSLQSHALKGNTAHTSPPVFSFPGDTADVESGNLSPKAYRHTPWAVRITSQAVAPGQCVQCGGVLRFSLSEHIIPSSCPPESSQSVWNEEKNKYHR